MEIGVGLSQAAIETIAPALVAEVNQAAEMNLVADGIFAHGVGGPPEPLEHDGIVLSQPGFNLRW